MNIFSKSNNIFAIALIVLFFLPWISMGGLITVSGYGLPDFVKGMSALGQSLNQQGDGPAASAYVYYILYLIPLLSIAILAMSHKGLNTNKVALITSIIPLAFFALFLAKNGTDIFEGMAIGAWLTLIAAVGLILSALGIINLNFASAQTEQSAQD